MKDNFTKETKPSRQTTLYSLIGVVGLMYAKDRREFEIFYKLATHDKGAEVWYRMQRLGKNIQ